MHSLTAEQMAENQRIAEEREEKAHAMFDELLQLDPDDLEDRGRRGFALTQLLRQFQTRGESDPFWDALRAFTSTDAFDARFQEGVVALMVAAEHAATDRAVGFNSSDGRFLTVRTMRALDEAHRRIGEELDRIRREA